MYMYVRFRRIRYPPVLYKRKKGAHGKNKKRRAFCIKTFHPWYIPEKFSDSNSPFQIDIIVKRNGSGSKLIMFFQVIKIYFYEIFL